MTQHRRITPEEVAAAAEALTSRGPSLPPMPLFDIMNFHATEARDRLADLWTLRDSLDVERPGLPVAIEHVAVLADRYAGTLDAVRAMAEDLGIPLDVDQ